MNTSRRSWALVGVLVVGALAPGAVSANSKFINVQGKLTDSAGNPLTGSQTVTFRLYTSSTAAVGSAFWTESQSLALSTGVFNATLGTTTALDTFSFNEPYYLGIQVAGDANELSPRQPLGASAYAQGSLGSFYVGTNLVVGSSVTIGGAGTSTLLLQNASPPSPIIETNNATQTGGKLSFRQSAGTPTSRATATSGSTMGQVEFLGYDGDNYPTNGGALIQANVEGTVADTRMPANLLFYTATNAAPSVLTERMRINSSGNVGISSTTPTDVLSVGGSINVSDGYKVGTTAGTSLTCGAAQVVTGSALKGGIATGGSCATVGDAVLSATQTWSGNNVFASTATIGRPAGKYSGLRGGWFEVAYSSGIGRIEFVLSSSNTYQFQYSISVASGSTMVGDWIVCRINNDATAGNYHNVLVTYPNPYNFSNQGAEANLDLANCGGGAVDTTSYVQGQFTLTSIQKHSNRLTATGTIATYCPWVGLQTSMTTFRYVGNPPWTLKCEQNGSGFGWDHEAILLQFGK